MHFWPKKGAERTVVHDGNCRKNMSLLASQKKGDKKICDLGSPGSRDFSNSVIAKLVNSRYGPPSSEISVLLLTQSSFDRPYI
jgi:hypothetical protein